MELVILLIGLGLVMLPLLASLEGQKKKERLEMFPPQPELPLHPAPQDELTVAASLLGLTQTERGATGMWKERAVQLTKGDSEWIEISVDAMPRGFSLMVRQEPGGVQTQDAAFDAIFQLQGSERSAIAYLDRATRKLVMAIPNRKTLTLKGGTLRLLLRRPLGPFNVRVPADALCALADVLEGGSVESRLLLRMAEPVPWPVSARLSQLIKRSPISARGEEVLAEMVADPPHPGAGLAAALALGDAGLSVLRVMVADEAVGPELRRRALQGLPEDEWWLQVVLAWLCSSDAALVRAGLSCAGQLRRVSPEVEAAALVILGEASSSTVQLEALEVLKYVGAVSAVEPIKPYTRRRAGDGSVRRAASEALVAIQSRLVDTGEGAFSLAESEDTMGAIGLVDEAAGALSVMKED